MNYIASFTSLTQIIGQPYCLWVCKYNGSGSRHAM